MKHHWSRCICLLLQVLLGVTNCLAVNLTLNVNLKRQISVTSGAFLSLTLDPATLVNTDAFTENSSERSANIMRGLAPAYVRFGGPQSNFYTFERTDSVGQNDVLSETQWMLMHRWAKNAGLDMIACIAPHYIGNENKTYTWDPTNAAELLSFSDRTGYNSSWQLGYECQTRCELSGGDLGRYVASLRKVLDTFPRYSDSLITGPDIVAYKTAQQRKYLRDYFESAGAALSVVTWHPEFAGATVNGDSFSVQDDSIAEEKDEMYKVIGHAAGEKPLWIAESGREESKHQYLGALVWTRRLGNAAKFGAQVIMRQPSSLNEATPDYWVSLLHKKLVGREVLDVRVQPRSERHVYFYGQCTKPTAAYERGAVTIFGVNLTPRNVTADLKGLKIKTLHEYILSPDSTAADKMLSEKVLLNGKSLDLINGKRLSELSPRIINDPDGIELNLASGSIGFWVIPNAKVKACTYLEEEMTKGTETRKLLRRNGNTYLEVNRKEEQEGRDTSLLNSINQKVYAKQKRRKQSSVNQRIETRKVFPRGRLFSRLKKLSRRKLRQKKDSSYLQGTSADATATEEENLSEEAKALEILNDKYLERVNDNEAVTNEDLLDALVKYENIVLEKKADANGTELNKSEMRNIDNILALTSKIKTSLQSDDTQVTSNGIRSGKTCEHETAIRESRNLQEQSDGLARKRRMSATGELEKYFSVLYDLLKDYEPTKIDENNLIFEHSAEKRRSRRDLSMKLGDLKKSMLAMRSKVEDLKTQRGQRIKLRNIDNRRTSSSSSAHADANKHSVRCFLRRNSPKSSTVSKVPPADSQHSRIVIQERSRITRDVGKRSTDLSPRREVFWKRSKIDDIRDERKIRRKEDLKRERLSNLPNSRLTRNDKSEFRGFARREPVKGFPESDVYISTGESKEQKDCSCGYDYVEDDEDNENNSCRKDSQKEQKAKVVERAEEDTMTVEDDGSYIPNEFYENLKISSAKIKDTAKDYGDLWEAEYFVSKHGDNEAVDGSSTTVANAKALEETNMQKPINRRDASEEKKYNQDKKFETACRIATSAYQSVPALHMTYENYGDHQFRDDDMEVSGFSVPIIAQIDSPINNKVLFNKRTKRSDWNKIQKLLDEEMIKEDANNAKDCHCRVIRTARSSPRSFYNFRARRNADESIVTEITDVTNIKDVKSSTQFDEDIRIPQTKEEYDKIMTGEILPKTSVTETDSDERKIITEIIVPRNQEPQGIAHTTDDVNSKLTDLETSDVLKRHYSAMGRTNAETSSLPTNWVPRASASSIEQALEKTFFRDPPADNPKEVQETTNDLDEAGSEVPPIDSESRTEPSASSIQNDAQVQVETICPCKKEISIGPQKSTETEALSDTTHSVDDGRKTREEKRNDDCDVNSRNSMEGETEGIAEYQVASRKVTSKRNMSETADRKTSSVLKVKRKLREDGNGQQLLDKQTARARAKESNDFKRLSNALQNFSKTSWKDLARYEEVLMKHAERLKRLKEKLHTGRENSTRQDHQNTMKITEQKKRNLKRREAWERFCASDEFRRLIGQRKLVMINEDMSYENDDDDDRDEEYTKKYISVELIPKRHDNLHDSYESLEPPHYPEHKSYYRLYQNPQIIDQKSTTASPIRKVFVLDPSTYHGGEPILQLQDEYLESPQYMLEYKPQPQLSKWLLKDFYRTLPKKFHGGLGQFSKSYDADYRDAARKSSVNERKNAVALYIFGRQRHTPKGLVRVLLNSPNVLDRRDVEKMKKEEATSESDEDNSNVEKKTIAGSVDEESPETEKYMKDEELTNPNSDMTMKKEEGKGEKKGLEEIQSKSLKTNGLSSKRENTAASVEETGEFPDSHHETKDSVGINKKNQNTEGTVDDSKFNEPKKAKNVRIRRDVGNRATEDEHQEQSRLSRAEDKNEADHEKYVSNKEVLFGNKPTSLLWLTRIPSDSVPLREWKSHAISSIEDVNDRRKERRQSLQNYMVLMPAKDEHVDSDEMISRSEDLEDNPEASKWVDRYLLKKLTDTLARYLFDESLYKRDYGSFSSLLSSAESILGEEASFLSDQSSESEQKVASSKERRQNGKRRNEHKHLRKRQQIRADELRRTSGLHSEDDGKAKRQRRQVDYEVDKVQLRTRKTILDDEDVQDRNNRIYRSDDSSRNEITREDYPRSQEDRRNHFLEDLLRFRTNKIISGRNEGNDNSLENNILPSDKNSPFSLQNAVLKLHDAVGDSKKTWDLTESTEQIVDDFKAKLNETLATNEDANIENETSESASNPFHLAIMKIRKFFTMFTGLSRVLRI